MMSPTQTFEWNKSISTYSGVNILSDLKKYNFIETNDEVEPWVYKAVYHTTVLGDNEKDMVIIIGENALSINDIVYTLKNEKEYEAFLYGIEMKLLDFGFNYKPVIDL